MHGFQNPGRRKFFFFFKKKKQSPNIWIDTELKLPGKQSHLVIILIAILLEKKMHTPKEQSRRHAKKHLQPLRRKPAKNHFKTVPVVLEDAVAFPVDLSERSTLPAACSTQPTLRCNLADRPEEPQQGQEQLDLQVIRITQLCCSNRNEKISRSQRLTNIA